MKGSKRKGRFLVREIVWTLVLFACSFLQQTRAATNIGVVASLSELTGAIDVAYTNSTMARVILPGLGTYTNDLDIIAYASGFESNILANLPAVTNYGVELRPVEVEEFTNSPRRRYYFSAAGIAVHTTTVGIANYPTNWIQSTYGTCPSWLTGPARTQWFTERDPSRQIVTFFLMSSSAIPVWCAAMTNVGHSIPSGETNLTFLQAYSNDVALAWVRNGSVPDLLAHAPTNVSTLDIYKSVDLTNSMGWQLFATVDHVTDPLFLQWFGGDPTAFFAAGNPEVDTDGDGLADVKEFFLTGTDPTLPDTVGDGLGDFAKVMTYGLSTSSADSDNDGLNDAYEIAVGLNPLSGDTDGDGLSDYAEVVTYFGYTFPTNADTDADGLNDYAEIVTHNTYAAPYIASSNCAADTDNDGLTDLQETTTHGTNPRSVDTDGDGMSDGFEIDYGLNPLSAADAAQDKDSDGFSNLTEYRWDTNPSVPNDYPSSFYLVSQGPGSNEMRRVKIPPHHVLAMGDLGSFTSLLRLPPKRFGTNLVERRLLHNGTAGFRINGTPAPSVASPIVIPPSTNAVEFKIVADAGYAGSDLGFTLTDTNGNNQGSVYFYSPKVTHAEFRAPNATYTDVDYGDEGALWYPMPADTNASRIYVCPDTTPANTYTSTRKLCHTDWLLARTFGPGSSPSTTTLNELDWRSAYCFGTTPRRTRGIQLVSGVHMVQVGIDANANSTLDTNEVHMSCKVYVPKIDLSLDSDNDGTITTNDTQVEDLLPGKVIWADKDLYWYTGTNDSDTVQLTVTFDMGGNTVPAGSYVVLQWFDATSSTWSPVAVYTDANCTTPLSRTGWHPTYSNTCSAGHLFDVGDTVPSTLYVKASGDGLRSTNQYVTLLQSMLHHSIGLQCYRRDTKSLVCQDKVKVTIANRPVVTPVGPSVHFWEEEQTLGSFHSSLTNIWEAIRKDMTTNQVHLTPYDEPVYHQNMSGNLTPQNFLALRNAHILVTDFHGEPGYVYPVAYPYTSEGTSNAAVWATVLGSQWATNHYSDAYTCYWVRVSTSYFETNWKSQRNANNAMLMTATCYSALPCSSNGLPSYIASVGGAFSCGSTSAMGSATSASRYANMLERMRDAQWRTAAGAIAIYGDTWGFNFAGSGRITLWPSVLRNGDEKAVYPTQCNTNGTVTVLFDTWMRETSDPIVKLVGDAGFIGGSPVWVQSGGKRCGLRWPYRNDTSTAVKTRMRVKADRCMAQPWYGGDPAKKFAGDGMSCGMNLEWEF